MSEAKVEFRIGRDTSSVRRVLARETSHFPRTWYHDEPFALYHQVESRGKCNTDRLAALMKSINDWHLFLAFNIIDGCTAGKSRDPLRWFFREVAGKVVSRFTEADIML
jgi:hypothetical protein